jgi:uncharacterized protein (TIGR03435 family)
MKLLRSVVSFMTLAAAAWGQQDEPLTFEVASVKANKSVTDLSPGQPSPARGGVRPGGRFTATNFSLRELILWAYDVGAPSLLEGGPNWLDSARYDIDAKAEAGAIPAGAHGRAVWDKTRAMLRALMAERFNLAVRRETRELPIYELTIAKGGPKLQKSDADCGANLYACHSFAGNPTHLSGTGVDIADIADYLSGHADRPVRDNTGIQGVFDIKMQWWPFSHPPPPVDDTPRNPEVEKREGPRPDFASLPTLDAALEQQLGLKLEARKGPVDIYVIDHVERPSEN